MLLTWVLQHFNQMKLMRPGEEFRQGFIETLPRAPRNENKYQFPLLALQGRGESMGWARRWLRWSARRLGGALCRDHEQYPAFAPGTSQLGLDLFVSCCHNFPQLHIGIIFNLLQSSRVPGPNLSPYNLRQWSFSAWFTP